MAGAHALYIRTLTTLSIHDSSRHPIDTTVDGQQL